MLAIVVTLLFAVYILGPDQFSRFILGFTIPRRNVTLTRSEEIVRAVVWAMIAVIPAFAWFVAAGVRRRLWSADDARTCFSGLYSEESFRGHQATWFHSLHSLLWVNIALLWRTYFIVLVIAGVLTLMTRYYSVIRSLFGGWAFGRGILATLVLPRIAPWHVLLSPILPDASDVEIHLDVLTKADNLYQGVLADKILGIDGALVSITLTSPKRFQRLEYLEAKRANTDPAMAPKAQAFWKNIPTNMFLLMGNEIQTINFRYVPKSMRTLKRAPQNDELRDVLSALSVAVKAAQAAKRKVK